MYVNLAIQRLTLYIKNMLVMWNCLKEIHVM